MKKKTFLVLFGLMIAVFMQSCFLFQSKEAKPAKPDVIAVGCKIGEMTVVWENKDGGSWKFLAMGTASAPMEWANSDSKYMSTSKFSSDMGMGKENSVYILSVFSGSMHTARNNAAKYCRKKGGWLPSKKEAKKVAKFANKKFWISQCERSSKAFYYDATMEMLGTAFRTDRKSIVTIPIYYLDEKGDVVDPE